MIDSPKTSPSTGKIKQKLAKFTRVFVALILVVGGVFAVLMLSDDPGNKLIDGESMETYKTSVSNIRDEFRGEKLKQFDDAIAVLDFVLKDAAYIEARGKTANEIIESSADVKKMYVDLANLDALKKYNELIKKNNDFGNNYDLTAKSFGLMVNEWNVMAGSIKCTEGDVVKAKSLLQKLETVRGFAVRAEGYDKTENLEIDSPVDILTFEDARKIGEKSQVYDELIAVFNKQFSSLDKDALLIQDVRDEVKTVCTK